MTTTEKQIIKLSEASLHRIRTTYGSLERFIAEVDANKDGGAKRGEQPYWEKLPGGGIVIQFWDGDVEVRTDRPFEQVR